MSKKMILLLTTLTISQQAHAMELSIWKLKNKLTHSYKDTMRELSFKFNQYDVYENLFGRSERLLFVDNKEEKRRKNNVLTLLAETTVITGAVVYLLLNGESLKTRKVPEASIKLLKASQNLYNTFTDEEKLGLMATSSLMGYLSLKALLSSENSFREKWLLSMPLTFGAAFGLGTVGLSDFALVTALLGFSPPILRFFF